MPVTRIPTADLMKKGLRRPAGRALARDGINSNRRPDEEGIKTGIRKMLSREPGFQPQT